MLIIGSGNLFAQRTTFDFTDIFKGKEIIKQTKQILNIPLSDFSLAYLGNDDCRILRNLIFFYHGYEFKSDDLNYLFENFYTRETPAVQSELSQIDKNNINLIQLYEARNIQSEAELKRIPLKSDLIGEWSLESFLVGDAPCAKLTIKTDKTFLFQPNINNTSPNITSYSGSVYCNSNTLFLYIKSFVISEEKAFFYFDPMYDYDSETKKYTLTLSEPIILSFPISMPERSEAQILTGWDAETRTHDKPVVVDNYIHMELGSLVFFKN